MQSTPGQDYPAECLQGQISHDLLKGELTLVHVSPEQMRSNECAPSPEKDSYHRQQKSKFNNTNQWVTLGLKANTGTLLLKYPRGKQR